jgi:hypothetical protein
LSACTCPAASPTLLRWPSSVAGGFQAFTVALGSTCARGPRGSRGESPMVIGSTSRWPCRCPRSDGRPHRAIQSRGCASVRRSVCRPTTPVRLTRCAWSLRTAMRVRSLSMTSRAGSYPASALQP